MPGTVLEWVHITEPPHWLTSGRPLGDTGKIAMVRTGVAMAFTLRAIEPGGHAHTVTGLFSWVGRYLDRPEEQKHQLCFDVGGTLAESGQEGMLRERLF